MITRLTDATNRLSARVQSRAALGGQDPEAGMVMSEYAMGTAVSAGCVGVVYKIVTSEQVLEVIKKVILKAFRLNF